MFVCLPSLLPYNPCNRQTVPEYTYRPKIHPPPPIAPTMVIPFLPNPTPYCTRPSTNMLPGVVVCRTHMRVRFTSTADMQPLPITHSLTHSLNTYSTTLISLPRLASLVLSCRPYPFFMIPLCVSYFLLSCLSPICAALLLCRGWGQWAVLSFPFFFIFFFLFPLSFIFGLHHIRIHNTLSFFSFSFSFSVCSCSCHLLLFRSVTSINWSIDDR